MFVILFFLSPILILVFHLREISWPWTPELFAVLGQTTIQALLSSSFSVVGGVAGALGLLSLSASRWRAPIESFVLLPALMPVLFVIVAVLNLVTRFSIFPFGMAGVILVHAVINTGLVSVALARSVEGRMSGMIELAMVEGASKKILFWVVLRGLGRDLFVLGFLIFVFCFTSFAVPLTVGAHLGETVEVLIYRAAFGEGKMSYALGLSILQAVILLAISFLIPTPLPHKAPILSSHQPLKSHLALVLLLGLTLVIVLSSLFGFGRGWADLMNSSVARGELWMKAVGTGVECLAVGLIILILLFFVGYHCTDRRLQRFLLGYSAPSSVITGLGFYLLFDTLSAPLIWTLIVMSLAFALVVFPALYRLGADHILKSLSGQIETARTLGASKIQILMQIIWPQALGPFTFLAGVGAFWASGDFALASMLAGRELTLALNAQSLLGAYRMESATVLTWMSLSIGLITFFVLRGIGHVRRA